MPSPKDTRAGGAHIELGLKDRLKEGLDKASAKLRSFSQSVAVAGAASAAAGVAVLTPLIAAAGRFANTADGYGTTAARAQLAASAVSELEHAARMTDVSAGGLEKGLIKLRKTVGDAAGGSKTAQDAFAALGLSWEDLAGLPLDQQLERVADAVAGIEDPSKKTAAAMDLFGKGGAELLPLLSSGAEGIQAWRKEAQQLGLAMTDAEVAAGGELSDNFDRLADSSRGLSDRIGAALAPALNEIVPRIVEVVAWVSNWIRENPRVVQAVASVAAGAVAFGSVLTGVAAGGGVLAAALSGVMTVLPILGTVFAAVVSPAGLGIAALGAATVAWVKYTDSGQAAADALSSDLSSLKDTAGTTLDGIMAALSSGDLSKAADILWAGLEAAWLTGVARLTEIWEGWKTGFVETFAGAAIALSGIWEDTINRIANRLLELAGQKGVIGDVFGKVLGVDLRSEEARSQVTGFKQAQINVRAQRGVIANREAETLAAIDDPERLAALNKQLAIDRQRLAEFERKAGAEAGPSVLSQTQAIVDDATAKAKEATAAYWADVAKTQRETSDQAIAAARDREAAARAELQTASEDAQLAAQTAGYAADFAAAMEGPDQTQAALDAAAAAAAAGLEDAAVEAAPMADKPAAAAKSGTLGTFGAYALGQMFAPNDVERKQLDELIKQNEQLRLIVQNFRRTNLAWT
jgi:hypothetical protein